MPNLLQKLFGRRGEVKSLRIENLHREQLVLQSENATMSATIVKLTTAVATSQKELIAAQTALASAKAAYNDELTAHGVTRNALAAEHMENHNAAHTALSESTRLKNIISDLHAKMSSESVENAIQAGTAAIKICDLEDDLELEKKKASGLQQDKVDLLLILADKENQLQVTSS